MLSLGMIDQRRSYFENDELQNFEVTASDVVRLKILTGHIYAKVDIKYYFYDIKQYFR